MNPDEICPKCGTAMEYDKGEPGDPQTMANPMGECPPVPTGWVCTNDDCDGFVAEDRHTKRLFGDDE